MGSVSAVLGRRFLIVEDEPLVALDLAAEIALEGGIPAVAFKVEQALAQLETFRFAAAIIDHRLHGGNACEIGRRLAEQGVPFVVYSGDENARAEWPNVPLVAKPALPQVLLQTICDLIQHQ